MTKDEEELLVQKLELAFLGMMNMSFQIAQRWLHDKDDTDKLAEAQKLARKHAVSIAAMLLKK